MTSPGTVRQTDNPPAAAAPALAYTPEQAAAIIGAGCKASYLRKLAREGKVPFLWVGKYGFTAAHVREIVAFCERSAKPVKSPAAPAARRTRQAAPGAAPVVEMLTARPPRRRTA